jgi:hypothetical protein
MASFRQEDKIKEVGAVNPIITQPVADTSTAEAITAAANTGIQIYGKVQQQRGKELAKQAEDELAAGVAYDQAGRYQSVGEQEAIALGADQGRALALGRGALTPTQFRARAEAKLKQAMAANPFFSDQIAQGFASVSGYDPRGSMTAALEEQLRMAQSAKDYDPAKKEKEAVANLAYILNIPYEKARVMRAQQVGLQYQVEMAQNQDLSNKREQMSLQGKTIAQGTQNFLGGISKALAKGPLTPEQVRQFKTDWAMHAENQREVIRAYNTNQNQKWLGETDYDEQMTRQTKFITELLDNNDAAQVLNDNKEYALAINQAAMLSDANVMRMFTMKQLFGEQPVSIMFEAMGNSTYAKFYEEHPLFKGTSQLEMQTLTISGFAKLAEGRQQEMTEQEKEAAKLAAKSDPRILAGLPKEMAEELIGTDPTSINTLAGPAYQTKIRKGEIKLPELTQQMNRMAQKQVLQYPVLSGKNKTLTGLELVGTGGGRAGGAQTYKLVDQDGEPVPDEIFSVYNAIKRVATRYPEITEGMSIQEFAIKTMLGEQQKEKPKPAPAPKPEPVPESLTENTQDKAAEFLAEFKRKYPSDAGQFTDEEILGFFNSGSGVA